MLTMLELDSICMVQRKCIVWSDRYSLFAEPSYAVAAHPCVLQLNLPSVFYALSLLRLPQLYLVYFAVIGATLQASSSGACTCEYSVCSRMSLVLCRCCRWLLVDLSASSITSQQLHPATKSV
jgi:hypothetical protein